jgi:hypothetical protein
VSPLSLLGQRGIFPRIFGLAPRLVALAAVCIPHNSQGAGVTCVDRLQIRGSTAGELRARLRSGRLASMDSPSCGKAAVTVQGQGQSFIVTLDLGKQKVSREVRSLNDVATWTESWLEPVANERAPGIGVLQTNSDAATQSELPSQTATNAPEISAQSSSTALPIMIAAGPEVSIERGGNLWYGPALFAQYRIGKGFWLGSGLGYAWEKSDVWEQSVLRAALFAGPAWNLSSRQSLTPGFGLGIYSAQMLDPVQTNGQKVRSGGGFAEIHLRSTYQLSTHLGLSSALCGRWYAFTNGKLTTTASSSDESDDESTTRILNAAPAAVPLWELGLSLELAYGFGGGP